MDATSISFELERVYNARSSNADGMVVYEKHITNNLCLTILEEESSFKAHNFPHSPWPLIFERTLKMIRRAAFVDGRAAQVGIIFYLLQGPARCL